MHPRERKNFGAILELLPERLGEDVVPLVNIVPSLGILVGRSPKTSQDESSSSMLQEAKNRFNYLLRKFFRVVGSLVNPLVLVLDDLQWADFESLELLQVLLTDPENRNLVVIGCYRSNERTPTHLLSKLIRDIKLQGPDDAAAITELVIENLTESDTKQLLLDLLLTDESKATGLARICHRKTHGNAFFLVHYLNMLHSRTLLEYNLGMTMWKWDEERIHNETGATENVVDLMKQKMKDLAPATMQLLQVAACLGSYFRLKECGDVLLLRATVCNAMTRLSTLSQP